MLAALQNDKKTSSLKAPFISIQTFQTPSFFFNTLTKYYSQDSTTLITMVQDLPPGFRFHPTEEELLQYYLRKKVSYEKIDLDVIRDVDLNKLEPWDIQGTYIFDPYNKI